MGKLPFPTIETPAGRRAWAFRALFGAALVFTAFAAFGVWQVRKDVDKTFWLAVIAHMQILVILSALSALLIRRTIKITREGAELTDHEVRDEHKVARETIEEE